MYLDFIQHETNDQKDYKNKLNIDVDATRITANPNRGLYQSFDIGEHPHKVTYILLDTRYHRERHWIRSVGEHHIPFSAMVAAAIRCVCGVLQLGSTYKGDILGADQWLWLKHTLLHATSHSNFVVIVSSIQIFTSNPTVESWGHFPEAKQRLVDLLQVANPSGVLFVSGDVHHAEVSSIDILRQDGQTDSWLEITSSGLTHACNGGAILKYLCPMMNAIFHRHRARPSSRLNSHSHASLSQGGRDDTHHTILPVKDGLTSASQESSTLNDELLLQRNFGVLRVYDCSKSTSIASTGDEYDEYDVLVSEDKRHVASPCVQETNNTSNSTTTAVLEVCVVSLEAESTTSPKCHIRRLVTYPSPLPPCAVHMGETHYPSSSPSTTSSPLFPPPHTCYSPSRIVKISYERFPSIQELMQSTLLLHHINLYQLSISLLVLIACFKALLSWRCRGSIETGNGTPDRNREIEKKSL